MAHFVEQNGPVSAVSWFASNMPKYEKTLKNWGPIRTHLLASAVSLLNACRYCSVGHIEALQLHYFKQYDKLFPLSTEQMLALHERSPSELINQLLAALRIADLPDEVDPLERLFVLYRNPAMAAGEDDNIYLHLIDMFAKLNSCGITADAELDQIHDPINLETDLISRYRAARDTSSITA